MGCTKSLNLNRAASGAHLSYYWTMNEVGGADKIDSAASHAWSTRVGSSSPAGLFSNGIQMDCLGGQITPNCHGLYIVDDPGLAINSVTSTGISFWFWAKLVADGATVHTLEYYFEFYTGGFASDYELRLLLNLSPGANAAGWTLTHLNFNGPESFQSSGSFTNSVGAWHMFAGTLDKTNQQLKFYIDGVLVDTQVDTLGYNSTTLGWAFLEAFFGGGGIADTFNAVVDEFGLSLKGALSQTQITALYNGGAAVTWPGVQAIVPYP